MEQSRSIVLSLATAVHSLRIEKLHDFDLYEANFKLLQAAKFIQDLSLAAIPTLYVEILAAVNSFTAIAPRRTWIRHLAWLATAILAGLAGARLGLSLDGFGRDFARRGGDYDDSNPPRAAGVAGAFAILCWVASLGMFHIMRTSPKAIESRSRPVSPCTTPGPNDRYATHMVRAS
jgi:hypothetical protein